MDNKKLDFFKTKEKCVICKETTQYEKNTHINKRYFYIDCVGQLCSKCYKKFVV